MDSRPPDETVFGYFLRMETGWAKIHNLDAFTITHAVGNSLPWLDALSAYTEFLGGALTIGLGMRLRSDSDDHQYDRRNPRGD